jgi:hypothetical protein
MNAQDVAYYGEACRVAITRALAAEAQTAAWEALHPEEQGNRHFWARLADIHTANAYDSACEAAHAAHDAGVL